MYTVVTLEFSTVDGNDLARMLIDCSNFLGLFPDIALTINWIQSISNRQSAQDSAVRVRDAYKAEND